ncbi:MAG TPA: hypothetical protein VMJ33_10010 [Gallionella sp.]|nr:hypothetical protein [Gallionella sp.]
MNRRKLLESAGLFIAAYLGLLMLSLYFGGEYAGLLLPLYRWELVHIVQDYDIQGLVIGDSHGEKVVILNLLTRHIVMGEHVFPPGIRISCSTLVGHALQHPMLALSLAVAWPASSPAQRIARLCCTLPFVLVVEMLDIPLVLLGSAQDLVAANLASDGASLLVGWMNFLNGGGRPALSLFAGMMAVCCGGVFFRVYDLRLSRQ